MADSSSEARDFIRKLSGFSVGPVVNGLLGLVSVPLITWLIDPEALGRASMYGTATGIIGTVLYLGLDNSYFRYFQEDEHRSLFGHSIALPLLLSVVFAVAILFAAGPVSRLLFGETDIVAAAVVAIAVPVMVLFRFSAAAMRAHELGLKFSLSRILEKIAMLAFLLVFALAIERSYRAVVIATAGAMLVATVVQLWWSRAAWSLSFSFDRALLRKLLKFGLPVVPAAALGWVFSSIDKVSLRALSTFQELGIFAGATRVAGMLTIVSTAFGSFWPPVAYRWWASQDSDHRFRAVSRYTSAGIAAVFAALIVARPLIMLLLPGSYDAAERLIPFLFLVPSMTIVSTVTVMGVFFHKRSHYHIWVSLGAAILNTIGNLLLIPRMGALGAAVSTGVSYIGFFWLRTLLSYRHWKVLEMAVHVKNTILMLAIAFTVFLQPVASTIVGGTIFVVIILLNGRDLIQLSRTVLRGLRKQTL